MKTELDIVSIGNLNIDFIGKLEKLPNPDEKALLKEFNQRPGGGGANFASACSKLGLNTGFIGCVGKDSFGEKILKDLINQGVDTSQVEKIDEMTGFAFIFSTPERDRILIEHRGANSHMKPSHIKESYLKRTKLVHASSVRPEIAKNIGKKAKKYNLKSSLDLGAELTKIDEKELKNILKHFNICFMNEETFENIFHSKPEKQKITQKMPEELDILVITLGSKGAIARNKNKTVTSPDYKVKAKDSTGAGDAFAAAFDKIILEENNLEKAMKYGRAEAAIKIKHIGGRKGLPTKKELESFIEENE